MRTSISKPKAHKEHGCDACLLPIHKGEVYDRCRWFDRDDAGVTRMHLECAKETDAAGVFDDGDRIGPGWLTEGENSPEWTAWYQARGVQS